MRLLWPAYQRRVRYFQDGAKKRCCKCFGRKNRNGRWKFMMRKDQLEGLIVSTIIDVLSNMEI